MEGRGSHGGCVKDMGSVHLSEMGRASHVDPIDSGVMG